MALNAQSVLSTLSNLPPGMSGYRTLDDAQLNSTTSGNALPFFPLIGPTLLSSLLSMSAMSEWLKLLLIGGIFQLCRRSWSSVYITFFDYFFITVDVAQTDPCYNWIMVWLTTQPSWSNPRNIQLGTETNELSAIMAMYLGARRTMPDKSNTDKKLTYKPSHSSSHSFWFKRRYLRINRWEKEATTMYRQKEEFLRLRILSRNHQILTDLLRDAEAAYKGVQDNSISIFVSDSQQKRWRHLATRRKRPLNSIVLDPGIKDRIVNDAREFLSSQDWYAARGIPFRRGYLLYGEPGSGKTSMIQCLAGELELDIYIVSLSRAGLDDTELNELISRLPERCIALMEDIDAAFSSTINRDHSDNNGKDSPNENPTQKQQKQVSKVTLSGLLNALDGVAAQEGRLLFATTNKYRSLDPALIRPGRMDLHIEFGLASKLQAKELYHRFYFPDKPINTGTSDSEKDQTEQLSEKEPLIQLNDTSSDTPECVPNVTPHAPLPLQGPQKEAKEGVPHDSHINVPSISPSRLEDLAATFSSMLPEREFSMASLQGHLMMYKTEPVLAVENFTMWMEQERKEKQERMVRAEKEKVVEQDDIKPTATMASVTAVAVQ